MFRAISSFFTGSVGQLAIVQAGLAADPSAALLQVYTWEHDRLVTLAKGMAASAASFLATLIIALMKGEIRVPTERVYLALCLPIELLLLAADSAWSARRLSLEYPEGNAIAGYVNSASKRGRP